MAFDANYYIAFTHVRDLKEIFETYLPTYLAAFANDTATDDYTFEDVTWYDYEEQTFSHLPAGLLLPERTQVVGMEAGSEIYETQIMLYVVIRDTHNKYPQRIALYEKALRDCVNGHPLAYGRDYRIGDVSYGMSRNSGSVRIKDLALTAYGRGQLDYPV